MKQQRQDYASLEDLQRWAINEMLRPYDLRIGDSSRPYMMRWWVIPRNQLQNVYLHEILRSDDPRALHDHPWRSTSVIIAGCYDEIMPHHYTNSGPIGEQRIRRVAGDIVTRKATDFHRLELVDDQPCISLFFTGPVVREWGFMCPQGWRHHNEFNDPNDIGRVGKGCGE